jgi:hypothetical protein
VVFGWCCNPKNTGSFWKFPVYELLFR